MASQFQKPNKVLWCIEMKYLVTVENMYFMEDIRATIYQNARWRSWLRHCATNREVAVSIPDGVIGNFHWQNPVGRTMALWSPQALADMSTRNISWGVNAAGA
jgi:hypothetical protein